MKKYQITKDFPGYVSKIDITNTDVPFLVRGSQNVLIDEAKRISSRKGYTLFGAAKTTTNRIRSSYDWVTSTDLERALRSYKNNLEVYAYGAWRTIKTGWKDKVDFGFAPWWDTNEQIDILLMVNGNDKIHSWSGAITKIREVTSTSISKMFYLTGATFAFIPGTSTIKPKITDTDEQFVEVGFTAGDKIVISGSADNDGTYTIASVSAGEIELIITDTLEDESTGATIVLNVENKGTWAEERFLTQSHKRGASNTQFDITNPSGTTFRYTYDGNGKDPVIDINTLAIGYSVEISGENFNSGNNGTFVVTGVGDNYFEVTNASGVAENDKTLGTGYLKFVIKKVLINGQEYNYTGGESTGTITGVTPSPIGSVNNADVAIQVMREDHVTPIEGAKNDIIEVLENQVYLASRTNREVYISQNNDFTDFSFTTPLRKPGEGGILTLDNPPTGFMPQETDMYIGAGKNDIYQTTFAKSSDNQYEAVTIKKFKTSTGQAPLSQNAITNIKNSVAFVTHEPTLDTLGRLEQINTQQSKPISDIIKNDFETYDLTDCHIKYWRNAVYITVPKESILLIYDIENGFWQPPQTIAISRLSVIGNELYGHSYGGNETYKLFDGYNDNGSSIQFKVVMSYENFGDRTSYKSFDHFFMEVYLNQIKDALDVTLNYEFEGSLDSRIATIDGLDDDLRFGLSEEDASLGSAPFGEQPLGSQLEDVDPAYDGTKKYRQIIPFTRLDFFEYQPVFETSKKNVRFKIIAFGPNATLSTNKPVSITK